jgi:hypothetical protein
VRAIAAIEADMEAAYDRLHGLAVDLNEQDDAKLQMRIQAQLTTQQLALDRLKGERQKAWDAHNERLLAKRADLSRLNREDATFWFRRFFTTLAIANAATFAALASGTVQADKPGAVAKVVAGPMIAFAWGMVMAGSLPLLLAFWLRAVEWLEDHPYPRRQEKRWWIGVEAGSSVCIFVAAAASALCLIAGLCLALWNLQGIIEQ